MKYVVKIEKVIPDKKLIIDFFNPDIQEQGIEEFVKAYLPYTTLYTVVEIKNFINIPAVLLERLTNQYLHGTEISIETPKQHFKQVYKCPKARGFYRYNWAPFSLSDPIPKSLANFKFTYNGKETTYLDAIQTLPNTRYIPNDIWNALDVYSRERIDTCRKYNEGVYSFAEEWFKQLTKDAIQHNMRVISPNKKTYFEAIAELDFERQLKDNYTLQAGLRNLTEEELTFLHKYAPAYGVAIPQLVTRINTRKTKHGYTQEPEIVVTQLTESDYNRTLRDDRLREKGTQLPWHVRRTLMPQVSDNQRLLREAYANLIWIMRHASQLPNNGLIDGYARCPHCHQIYHEAVGCDCEQTPAVEFLSTPNLFYSDAGSYELHGISHKLFD